MNWNVLASTTGLLILSNLFMTCAIFYMNQPLKWDNLWAAMCMMGAVYFIFR